MSSIDTRIVEMRINNKQFLAGIKETLAALQTLEKAIQMKNGTKGFTDLNAAANRVNFSNINTQANKANQSVNSISSKGVDGLTGSANRVDMSNINTQANKANQSVNNIKADGVENITKAANRVSMLNISAQADRVKEKLSSISGKSLDLLSAAANRVNLGNISKQAVKADRSINDISGEGLTNLTSAANRVDLSHIGKQADGVSSKITAMSVAAVAALGTITSRATSAGMSLTKSLTIQPVMDGLREYETGLNSVQTIMSNTQAAGTTLPQVNAALKDLNHYADKTIYNFSEMTRNVGTFTAAGVDLNTAQQSIKGIANLAALSGSNSVQASTAMYQLSQAISAGKVSLMDWNSVVNAGMGGSVFQRALAQTAVKMGTLDKSALSLNGKMKNVTIEGKSFRDSISAENGESWLTSDVLTTTLKQLAGGFSEAELKAQGFNDAEVKAIQTQAKMAEDAATKVKTFTQLLDTTKEAVGSGWADTWQIIFGDFEGAKKLWTGVSNVISDMVGKSANARNKVLTDWAKLGGRTDFLAGIKNVFEGLKSVINPIRQAFREIFPATTGKQLAQMSKSFREITSHMKLGKETAKNLKNTFQGVFAIFGIGWEIIKGFGRVILEVFKSFSGGSGSVLKFTGSIGVFLTHIHKAIKEGEGFKKFFEILGKIISAPIKIIMALSKAIGNLFKGSSMDMSFFESFKSGGDILDKAGKVIDRVIKSITDGINKMSSMFGGADISGFFSKMFEGVSLDNILAIGKALVSVALGISSIKGVKSIKSFFDKMGDGVETVTGLFENLTAPFEEVTETLSVMQKTLKAVTLLAIAAAIGILVASLVSLSKIDQDDLKKALAAMAGAFAELIVAMIIFQRIQIGKGMGQLILLAAAIKVLTSALVELSKLHWEDLAKGLLATAGLLAGLVLAANMMPDGKKMISSSLGLILLASAVKILASAVEDLAKLSWNEIAKGLTGVGGVLAALMLFTKFSKADKMSLSSGAGLILLAAGLKLIAGVVKDFSKMNWEDLAKGLAGVAGSLVALSIGLKAMPPTTLLSAAAILVVALSLNKIADAVGKMGELHWEQIAKGVAGLAGALTGIALALRLMPPSTLLSAAAIFIVASSLGKIGDAMNKMSEMSWNGVVKGLVGMAGALTGIALALNLMPPSTLLSAAAIFIVASSLGSVADALNKMGEMKWSEVAKGLVAMAGALTAIGLALTLMPPTTLLSAAAILVVASSLGMISDALLKMATMSWNDIAQSLVALAGSLTIIALAMAGMTTALPGAAALLVVCSALWILVPLLIQLGAMSWEAIGKGLVALAGALTVIGVASVALTAGIPSLLSLGVAIAAIGVAVLAAGAGMYAFAQGLSLIGTNGAAAMPVMQSFLTLITTNIPLIATALGQAVMNFLNVIRQNGPIIVQTFVTIVSSILTGIRTLAPQIGATFTTILQTILRVIQVNAPGIINTFVGVARQFLAGVRRLMPDISATFTSILQNILRIIRTNTPAIMATFTTLLQGLLKTIRVNTPSILATFLYMLDQLLLTARRAVPRIVNAGADIIIGFLNGMARKVPGIVTAATNLIVAFLGGIANNIGRITDAGVRLIIAFINGTATAIRRNQQAMRDAGKNLGLAIIDGMTGGLAGAAWKVVKKAGEVAKSAYEGAKKWLHINSPSKKFIELGKWTAEGMAVGIERRTSSVYDASSTMAKNAYGAAKTWLGINSPSKKFQELGKYSADGYIKGLNGNASQIKDATDTMRSKINDALKSSRADMAKHQAALNKLLRTRRWDKKKIAVERAAYNEAYREVVRLQAAQSRLNSFSGKNAQLTKLANEYDAITPKLEDARKKFEEIIKARDEYYNSVKSQYYNLPEYDKDTKYDSYIKGFQKQIVNTQILKAQLEKLRSLGLNDDMYKDLVAKGTDAIPFITQILNRGKVGVKEINDLSSALQRSSAVLATKASSDLYDVGMKSTAGLINGMANRQKVIDATMDNISKSMLKQMKSTLGIKSPSREFMEIGRWSILGLAKGLAMIDPAVKAADVVGSNAAASLRRSLVNIGRMVSEKINPQPTIKPVLDLSGVKKTASTVPGMLGHSTIAVKGSYLAAAAVAKQVKSTQQPPDFEKLWQLAETPTVQFNQYNSSPKALSPGEIYRQTNNQVSRLKGLVNNRA